MKGLLACCVRDSLWHIICMETNIGDSDDGFPSCIQKRKHKRITLRCILVSSLKFQIIIFVYYSNFMLHFILCFSKIIVSFWTAVLNKQDCKSNSVKYRFSGLVFRFLCKLVPCSIPVRHTKKLTIFFLEPEGSLL